NCTACDNKLLEPVPAPLRRMSDKRVFRSMLNHLFTVEVVRMFRLCLVKPEPIITSSSSFRVRLTEYRVDFPPPLTERLLLRLFPVLPKILCCQLVPDICL